MEEILRSQWNYILYKKDDNLILSVVCGTVALFEVNIILNSMEVESYNQRGEDYINELAGEIRFSPKSFNKRHVGSGSN